VISETVNYGINISFIGMMSISSFVKPGQLFSKLIQGRDMQSGSGLNPNIVKQEMTSTLAELLSESYNLLLNTAVRVQIKQK
jgi:hypothetical protein